jgi:hypothetical protein
MKQTKKSIGELIKERDELINLLKHKLKYKTHKTLLKSKIKFINDRIKKYGTM